MRLVSRLLLCAVLAGALLGTLLGLGWSATSIGCTPAPLPHWLPTPVQATLEARCHA